MATRYHGIDWNRLHQDARQLAGLLAHRGPDGGAWRCIVAIARGGLVPAAILARELDCRMVETIAIATYEGEARGLPRLLKPPAGLGGGEGCLVVDDLVDSGTTIALVRGLLPKATYACLYAKPAGQALVDHHVAAFSQDTWLLFPWDMEPG